MILQAPAADFDRTLDVERALLARARLLLDISKLLSIGSAQKRAATTQTPRRPTGAGGGGASRSGSVSVNHMHAPFKGEVECKMTSGSTEFCVAHLGFEQPYRELFVSRAQRLPKIIAASEYATHNSSNANILKRRDPKQKEFTRYFKEIVRARIRQFESDMPSHAVVSNSRSALVG